MISVVKSHLRKGKNKTSYIRQHTRMPIQKVIQTLQDPLTSRKTKNKLLKEYGNIIQSKYEIRRELLNKIIKDMVNMCEDSMVLRRAFEEYFEKVNLTYTPKQIMQDLVYLSEDNEVMVNSIHYYFGQLKPEEVGQVEKIGGDL